MAEVDDWSTGRQEHEPITPEQMALYAKAHGADRPCEACGGNDFIMRPDAEDRGVVVAACRQCYAVRKFLRPPVMAWLRRSRHG